MSDEFAQPAKQPFQMPETPHKKHADGIYFNLPEEEYHADPALGSSGVRDLLQSPLTYWINSPYNPNRPEDNGTEATDLGTYVHDRLLHDEKKFAIKPEGMSFATKEGKAWRDAQPYGTTIIPFKNWQAAELIFEAMEAAGIMKHFTGGEPEVSFFWTEPGGFRCKIRIDYLRPYDAFELKTYANTMMKDTETAIAHAVATCRYHISGFWYATGIERMRKALNGPGLKTHGPLTENQTQLLNRMAHHQNSFPLWFIFMETGGVPNLTVRRFVERDSSGEINAYFRAAKNETDRATSAFAKYMQSHGPDKMWIDRAYSKPFVDEDFTAARWILEEQ